MIQLNEQTLKEWIEQVGLNVQADPCQATHLTSSLLLAALGQRESKKDQATHAPQDRDGHGSNRRSEQDHTHD